MDTVQTIATLGLLWAAFWRGQEREGVLLFCMAGAAMIAFGLVWTDTYTTASDYVLSIACIGIGIYCFILAILGVLRRIKG